MEETGNGLSLIAAIAISMLTMFILYMAWYIAYGRKARARKKEGGSAPADTAKEGKWGFDKDSYCYPSINDKMGYEFISVVKVTKEDLEPNKPAAPQRPAWEDSQGLGALRTISSNETPEEQDEDDPYPDMMNNFGTRGRNAGGKTEEKETEEEEKSPLDNLSDEELEMMMSYPEWDNVRTNNIPSEEELNELIDNNEDLIEQTRIDEEQVKTANEINEMRKFIMASEKIDYGEKASSLMGDLMDEGNEEEVPVDDQQEQEEPEEGEDVDFMTDEEDYNQYQNEEI